MADPIVNPIVVDPEDLFQQFVEHMQSVIPGWEPSDGSLDVWLAEGFAQVAAQVAETASDATTSIFRWYGANITGIPPVDAVAATSTVTINASDTAGHTVPAGTNLALTGPDGELVPFVTTANGVIPGGSSSVAGVPIAAAEDAVGEAGNDLTGTVTLIDSVAYVSSITLGAATGGGSDAEEDEDYLTRLVEEERLKTVSPILPRDFAKLAKRVLEVDRAAYLDGYNPANGTSNNPLTVTLVPVQADGSNVSAPGKTAIADQFGENGATPALQNFVVNVADPHRTAVDVSFTAVSADGWAPADVETAGEQAIADYLDPGEWGQPQFGDERKFEVIDKVRLGAIYRVLYDVEGLLYVTALTIEGAAVDYTLPTTQAEPVAIAEPGTIAGTVT